MPRARHAAGLLAGVGLLTMAVLWTFTREPDYARVVVADIEALERELEALRVRLRIPSLSAAVARDGDIL